MWNDEVQFIILFNIFFQFPFLLQAQEGGLPTESTLLYNMMVSYIQTGPDMVCLVTTVEWLPHPTQAASPAHRTATHASPPDRQVA